MKTSRLPLAALAALITSTSLAYTQTAAAQTSAAPPAATSGESAGNTESTIQMLEDAIKKLEDAAESSTTTNQPAGSDAASPAAPAPAQPAATPATQPDASEGSTGQSAAQQTGDGAADASEPVELTDDAADAVDPVIIIDSDGDGLPDSEDAAAGNQDAASQQPASAPAPTPLVQLDDANVVVSSLDLPIGKLKGMEVHDPDGKTISTVKDVLGTPDGKPVAIALDIGGFLGIGAKEVVIPVEVLKLSEDKKSVSVPKDQMANLPISN
ncbi:PRC-barrel domain-containing protein [Rhodoligotrophos defluvii]|uniref:PRC-barrel domain-containing protein n=1 Tax=Rhodoligotrophos defluvii TaxID=2561934 RepID=UPI0010CA1749|nr:PRC-barrel domain-containing protein [Rhodoligotrophos defluvii]